MSVPLQFQAVPRPPRPPARRPREIGRPASPRGRLGAASVEIDSITFDASAGSSGDRFTYVFIATDGFAAPPVAGIPVITAGEPTLMG